MRIVAGGPSADPTSPLATVWAELLRRQMLPPHIQLEVVPWPDEEVALARDYRIQAADHTGHHWSARAMRRVGWLRQTFADYAFGQRGADAIWLVDDDLLCAPDVLARLLRMEAPVTYGIFWTQIDSGERLPQCWDVAHPAATSQHAADVWAQGGYMDVVGGGACTLIRRDAWATYRWHPQVPGLPLTNQWQGEDRSACIRACAALPPVRQLALGGLRIHHCYREEDRVPDAIARGLRWVGARDLADNIVPHGIIDDADQHGIIGEG